MKTFLGHKKPLLVSMVQGSTPDRVKALMKRSAELGAEAFGIQLCKMLPEFRTEDVYRDLFSAYELPTYVTNYRYVTNAEKSDGQLAQELIQFARCGATLCDVMGDYFDACPTEYTENAIAVQKQKELIAELHGVGAEVLMSTHSHKFLTADEVLRIAYGHKERGADICKIVAHANSAEQQAENMRMIDLLKRELDIPFLFLCGGEYKILRRVGGELGNCMSLCVSEYDELATTCQPLLEDMVALRDIFDRAR